MSIIGADVCPCGSEKLYVNCCEPFHKGDKVPSTAEWLMRSRFVAYRYQLVNYLLVTWDQATKPEVIEIPDSIRWTGLVINGKKKGRKKDQEGWVTFLAFYDTVGHVGVENHVMHEKSYFKKDSLGHWKYVDGEIKN